MQGLESFFLFCAGLVAGFIDSIAGGGGLISLPSFAVVVGPGPLAIGTNKIAGVTAAFVALVVYHRAGHIDWKRSLEFSLCVAVGSFCGSRVSPLLPKEIFRFFLLVSCPLILWIVWHRELWIKREAGRLRERNMHHLFKLVAVGFLCGFYDGVWGPGGGTFMFLGLLFVVGMPLFGAIGASKIANTLSASVSLASYASQGYVNWTVGFELALGIGLGAFFGARLANLHAARVVRPLLAVVSVLLLIKTLWG